MITASRLPTVAWYPMMPCHHIPFYKFLLVSIIYLFTLEAHSVVLISKQCYFSSFLWLSVVSVSIQHCVSMIYIYLFSVLYFIGFFNDFNLWWWNTLTYLLTYLRDLAKDKDTETPEYYKKPVLDISAMPSMPDEVLQGNQVTLCNHKGPSTKYFTAFIKADVVACICKPATWCQKFRTTWVRIRVGRKFRRLSSGQSLSNCWLL